MTSFMLKQGNRGPKISKIKLDILCIFYEYGLEDFQRSCEISEIYNVYEDV